MKFFGSDIATLTKRNDYTAVSKKNRKFSTSAILIMAHKRPPLENLSNPDLAPEPRVRIGITVTKKVGKAVIRNRIKRRYRALIRGNLDILRTELRLDKKANTNWDMVFVGRLDAATCPYDQLNTELRTCLHHIAIAFFGNSPPLSTLE